MKENYYVCSFSGGKDSTAMLLKLIELNYPLDEIIFCDTGVEFDEVMETIQKVEEYIQRPITRLKSKETFYSLGKKYGFPWIRGRWCTGELKNQIINKYLSDLKKKYKVIEYIGIAADEGKRIKNKSYPLVELGMTEKDCLEYCYNKGFTWGGLYEDFDRLSCWCCPLKNLKELRIMYHKYPQYWNRIKKLEEDFKDTKAPNFTIKASLSDLERRFVIEDEFLSKQESIRSKKFFQTLKDNNIKY